MSSMPTCPVMVMKRRTQRTQWRNGQLSSSPVGEQLALCLFTSFGETGSGGGEDGSSTGQAVGGGEAVMR